MLVVVEDMIGAIVMKWRIEALEKGEDMGGLVAMFLSDMNKRRERIIPFDPVLRAAGALCSRART